MIRIYQGTGHTDAYLVRDWLERNGIRSTLHGQELSTVNGEVRIGQAWPSVWVGEADKARAEEALALYRSPTLVHPEWVCTHCDEVNGAAFASCWNCERER